MTSIVIFIYLFVLFFIYTMKVICTQNYLVTNVLPNVFFSGPIDFNSISVVLQWDPKPSGYQHPLKYFFFMWHWLPLYFFHTMKVNGIWNHLVTNILQNISFLGAIDFHCIFCPYYASQWDLKPFGYQHSSKYLIFGCHWLPLYFLSILWKSMGSETIWLPTFFKISHFWVPLTSIVFFVHTMQVNGTWNHLVANILQNISFLGAIDFHCIFSILWNSMGPETIWLPTFFKISFWVPLTSIVFLSILCKSMGPETIWLPTFFKISHFWCHWLPLYFLSILWNSMGPETIWLPTFFKYLIFGSHWLPLYFCPYYGCQLKPKPFGYQHSSNISFESHQLI